MLHVTVKSRNIVPVFDAVRVEWSVQTAPCQNPPQLVQRGDLAQHPNDCEAAYGRYL